MASALLAKWLAVGVATTALAVGTVKGAHHFLAASPVPPQPVAAVVAPIAITTTIPSIPSIPSAASAESADAPVPAPVAIVVPAPARMASDVPREVTAQTPEPSAHASVADEARLVERARTALAQDDPAAATAALEEHDRVYPGGAFADEARVVRIDVLARTDRAAARTAAEAFLAAHPASPYATGLRQLAGTK